MDITQNVNVVFGGTQTLLVGLSGMLSTVHDAREQLATFAAQSMVDPE